MTISELLIFIAENNLNPDDLIDVECSDGSGICDDPTLALTDSGRGGVSLPTLTIRTALDADGLISCLTGE